MKTETKKCRSCKADIPADAKVCQHCRAKQGSWFARHKILTGFLVLFILAAIGSGGDKNKAVKNTAAPSTEVVKEEVKKNDPEITMEEFTAIKNGMTYQQVVDIVGGPGVVSSESEFGSIKSTLYQFKGNKFASNASVTIQNGKVTLKAQFGLN